jgi:hypothetical protein
MVVKEIFGNHTEKKTPCRKTGRHLYNGTKLLFFCLNLILPKTGESKGESWEKRKAEANGSFDSSENKD